MTGSAANPVDVPLLPEGGVPSSAGERMASHGVVLASPTDAARAYPDLFPTVEAAKKAFHTVPG